MKKQLSLVLRLLVSGGLLAYLIWKSNPAAIWESWQQVDLPLLGLALLVQFAAVAANAAKWNLQLRARGEHLPYHWMLGVFLTGQFANNFLPTSVGGDALRVAQLGRRIGRYGLAGATVFFDRLSGFAVLSAVASAILLLGYVAPALLPVTTPLSLALLAFGFTALACGALTLAVAAPGVLLRMQHLPLPGVVQRPLGKIVQVLASDAPRGRVLLVVLAMSLVYQSLWIAMHVVCGAAFGLGPELVPLLVYALMVTITDILGLAPIFFNNLGAREGVFILYLTQLAVARPTAVALALLVFTVRLAVSVLGGLVLLFGGASVRKAPASGEGA